MYVMPTENTRYYFVVTVENEEGIFGNVVTTYRDGAMKCAHNQLFTDLNGKEWRASQISDTRRIVKPVKS